MELALSTRWNAYRHGDGAGLIDEVLELGFRRVELGYDLTFAQAEGVRRRVQEGVVRVDSVHAFCPTPIGASHGNPELFFLASCHQNEQTAAIRHLEQTARFASEVGARVMIVHAGRVRMRHLTPRLIARAVRFGVKHRRFTRLYDKLLLRRGRVAQPHIDQLCRGLDALLPRLESLGVLIALENLPSWEAVPSEAEMLALCLRYSGSPLRYWHDTGHGQIRENLGFIAHKRWFERLLPHLAGLHLHDVAPPAADHIMPPLGTVRFSDFTSDPAFSILHVIEPAPGTPREQIAEARRLLTVALKNIA